MSFINVIIILYNDMHVRRCQWTKEKNKLLSKVIHCLFLALIDTYSAAAPSPGQVVP